MTFEEFSASARRVFEEIPIDYKEGVDGLEIARKTVPHPTLPGVYTLGECLSEFYPSEFGGTGEVRSRVALYYGSFLALSRVSEDWDWEHEVWETITHEIRHHLEFLAAEDALEVQDYAEDQNFARRDGKRFDPFFYRAGNPVAPGAFEVDGDVFLEQDLTQKSFERERSARVEWDGRVLRVPLPGELGDVHFVRLKEVGGIDGGEVFLVLVRRRGLGAWLRGVLRRDPLRIEESDADVEGS